MFWMNCTHRHSFDPLSSIPPKPLSLFIFVSFPFPRLSLCVICRHLKSGRGVVFVLLAGLRESMLNLIGMLDEL